MRAMVLAGGGSKGAFQVGVIRGLESAGLSFDYVSGASVGALNGAAVAQGSGEELEQVWRSIRSLSDVFSLNWTSWLPFFGAGVPSMYKPGPVLLNAAAAAQRTPLRTGCRFDVAVTDLHTGNCVYIDVGGGQIAKTLLASIAIPVLLPPVDNMVDGSVRAGVPLRAAIRAGATEIHVLTTGRRDEYIKGSFNSPVDVALRSVQVISNGLHWNDIDTCLLCNRIEGYRKIDLYIYEPDIELDGMMTFEPSRISAAIESGRRSAAKTLAAGPIS